MKDGQRLSHAAIGIVKLRAASKAGTWTYDQSKQSGAFSGHRFPSEIIAYAVWAYHRFPMSLRDVEDLLAARGVMVSYVLNSARDWPSFPKRSDPPAVNNSASFGALILAILERSHGCILEDNRGFEKSTMCAFFYEIDLDQGIYTIHAKENSEMKQMGSFVITNLPSAEDFLAQLGYTDEFLDGVMATGWRTAA